MARIYVLLVVLPMHMSLIKLAINMNMCHGAVLYWAITKMPAISCGTLQHRKLFALTMFILMKESSMETLILSSLHLLSYITNVQHSYRMFKLPQIPCPSVFSDESPETLIETTAILSPVPEPVVSVGAVPISVTPTSDTSLPFLQPDNIVSVPTIVNLQDSGVVPPPEP